MNRPVQHGFVKNLDKNQGMSERCATFFLPEKGLVMFTKVVARELSFSMTPKPSLKHLGFPRYSYFTNDIQFST
jgi:hypothetical protein